MGIYLYIYYMQREGFWTPAEKIGLQRRPSYTYIVLISVRFIIKYYNIQIYYGEKNHKYNI